MAKERILSALLAVILLSRKVRVLSCFINVTVHIPELLWNQSVQMMMKYVPACPAIKWKSAKNAKHPCQSRPVMAARANLLENAGKHLAVVVRAAVQCC
jgi:hypothetical protein